MNHRIIPFYNPNDIFIVKAGGSYMWDENGHRYIDFESGEWSANLGHSHEAIVNTLYSHAKDLIHDGVFFRNAPAEELSLLLTEKLGLSGGQSAFLSSGSEAVNLGISLARHITGRKKILKVEGYFLASHGEGKIDKENKTLIDIPLDDLTALSKINMEEFAAFVFEPGNAWGLVRFPDNDFITQIAHSIKKNKGLFIVNEVTTGLGRTGKWFGHEYYDLTPDIITVGKALGNGYPVSGITISRELAAQFRQNPFRYVQSHQNDPLGCAIGCEVIKTLEREKLIEAAYQKGEYFKDELFRLQHKFPKKIKDIRGRGLMIAVEFFHQLSVKELSQKLFGKGFIAGYKEHVLRLMPPLIIEKEDILGLIEALEEIII